MLYFRGVKSNALSIANYFVSKSIAEGTELKPLKLMKLVYIAHGYMLALLNKSFLDPRFDKVEAWKLGPVIPSVYHTFKHYRDGNITELCIVFSADADTTPKFETPTLDDEKAREICDFVWNRYAKRFTDSQLVTFLHADGTPWKMFYIEGENVEIPDVYTSAFYRKQFNHLVSVAQSGR